MVDLGYSVQDMASPIIGYSLFYHGDNGPLVIADAAVNPMQKDAVAAISKLVATSLDSIANPDGSKMYFLGIHDLDLGYLSSRSWFGLLRHRWVQIMPSATRYHTVEAT